MSTAAERIEHKLDQVLAQQAQIIARLDAGTPTQQQDTRRPPVGSSIHPRDCECEGSGWVNVEDPTQPGTTVVDECPGRDGHIAPILTIDHARNRLAALRARDRHPTNQEPPA